MGDGFRLLGCFNQGWKCQFLLGFYGYNWIYWEISIEILEILTKNIDVKKLMKTRKNK